MKNLVIDPPSGWKYGFPKPIPVGINNTKDSLHTWLIKEGYPMKEIERCGDYFICRYWEEDVDSSN